MPQVQQMKGPLELSVFLIGTSAEAATAFRADGVLVRLFLSTMQISSIPVLVLFFLVLSVSVLSTRYSCICFLAHVQ